MEVTMSNLMVRELIDGLKHLESSLSGAASRNPRLSFSNVLNFLGDHSTLSVEQLASMLAATKPKPKRKRRPATPDEKLVTEWVARLRSAEHKLDEFEEVFEELQGDSDKQTLRKVELQRIGELYANRATEYSTKSVALRDIRKHFEQRLRTHQREKVA
jgi:hypothetical protein